MGKSDLPHPRTYVGKYVVWNRNTKVQRIVGFSRWAEEDGHFHPQMWVAEVGVGNKYEISLRALQHKFAWFDALANAKAHAKFNERYW